MAFIKENIKIVVLLALLGVIILGNLGGWELKGADEPRYAQIAREMFETGQYILPHVNAEPYPDKPPLFFWLIALASLPAGDVSALAARLPSALASLGMMLLTYILAARLFNRTTALLAVSVLFCCEQFFSKATSAHFDTLLAFWTTLAMLLFHTGYTCEKGGKKYMLGAYVAMGFAILTKGPVGLVIPLLAMLLFVITRKEFSRIKELQLGTGLIIAVGIIAAWLVPACLMGGEAYTQNILFKQTFGRTVGSFAHNEPFYFYIINFPVDFLPWTPFLPAAGVYFWKERERNKNILLPLIWFIATFILFSLISGKRSLYLLPLYPAVAILMAKFFNDFIRNDATLSELSRQKLFIVPCYIMAGLVPAAGAAGIVMLIGNMRLVQNLGGSRWVLFAAACCAIAAGVVWFRGKDGMRRLRQVPYLTMGCVIAMYGLWAWIVMPPMVKNLSDRAFYETILKTVRPEDKLYATFPPSNFNYFLHRYPIPEVQDEAKLEGLIGSPDTTYFLVKAKDYEAIPDSLKKMITVLDKKPVGHKTVYLLVNTPPQKDF